MKKHLFALCTIISMSALQAAVIEVKSTQELNKQLKNGNPSAVCFYSPTCPHCRSYEPRFMQMSGRHDGVNFMKVNVKANGAVASPYGVTGVPKTIVFDKGGKQVDSIGGNNPAKVEASLKKVAAPKAKK